ncbi:MAG: NAD(P)H-dependent oxidoreductase [Gammaproteobacteria bacterium]|nr:NAD(P)H-dependent oxidoreductase [Gammaproteobacteria bacterium]MCB1880259.1 NAD(P)H-dependent oxidoreductase [Gammaproteobacteria bacterium]
MKHLLIVYHSQTGHTQALAESVYRGALDYRDDVETRLMKACDSGEEELLWADAVIFGTPENFGYMSGALKDFFDRTYEATRDATVGLPYAIFISAGNDGSGAEFNIDRIARGYSMKRVSEPLIVRGEVDQAALQQAEELGQTLAAALELGVF